MQSELISVVIPVYNVENYLRHALESVCNQTYTNLEIIVINDGTQDRSLDIAQEFATRDSRIIIHSQKNAGLSMARNAGMALAHGEFIYFFDSDDLLHHSALERLMDSLIRTHADLAVGGVKKFIEGTSCDLSSPSPSSTQTVLNQEDAITGYFYRKFPGYAWHKLIKKSVLANSQFEPGKLFEDAFILPEWLLKVNTIVIADDSIYFYRQRPGSIVSGTFSRGQFDLLEARKKWIQYFEKDPEILPAAEEAYFRSLADISRKIPRTESFNPDLHATKAELKRLAPMVRKNKKAPETDRALALLMQIAPSATLELLRRLYRRSVKRIPS